MGEWKSPWHIGSSANHARTRIYPRESQAILSMLQNSLPNYRPFGIDISNHILRQLVDHRLDILDIITELLPTLQTINSRFRTEFVT